MNVFQAGIDIFMGDFAYFKIAQPSFAKLRRFGFCGSVNLGSVFEMYKDMAKLGVIPSPKVEAARPII